MAFYPLIVFGLAVACAVVFVAGAIAEVPALTQTQAAMQPAGSYCGRYSIVNARAIFDPPRGTVTLSMKPMLGSSIVCSDVPYAFDAATGSLVIPAAADPTSCVGDALGRANLQRAVAVVFDAANNRLSFQSGAVNVALSPCV